MDIESKYADLRRSLKGTGGLAVAFSGGVDSSFLAAVAQQELADRAIAVTALSPTYPEHMREDACNVASIIGIKHVLVESNELEIPGFADNPVDRCYHCKRELFKVVADVAARHGIRRVADGSNADDVGDYRPGMKAANEAGVLSPLLEAGLGKEEIRILSRRLKLPTAEKPAFACLASRFPYGTKITESKLKAVDTVEIALRKLGFGQVRVRHHGDVARIEVSTDELARLVQPGIREQIVRAAQSAGFIHVSADLRGYRTGSMNDAIRKNI
jgi:uncharacterized protein